MATIEQEVEALPAISAQSAGLLMTPEEFDAITDYDELYSYELVHGVLVVKPIPSEQEAHPNEILGYLLLLYQEAHPQGSALDLSLPERYVRTADSRRKADRVIWAGLGRRPRPTVDVPTIVIEFVSKGKANWTRDYITKRREYLAIGVMEYWVIDRFKRTLTIFRDEPAETIIPESQTYQTALLPGFELPLKRLLAAADAWNQPEG